MQCIPVYRLIGENYNRTLKDKQKPHRKRSLERQYKIDYTYRKRYPFQPNNHYL